MAERYHPFSESLFDDPWPIYRRLRDEAPAYYLQEFDCWFLSRFEDVWNAASDARFLAGGGVTTLELLLGQRFPNPGTPFASMDPPRHTELRRLLAPAFLPAAARRLEAPTRELVRRFLDEELPRGELDLIGDLAMRTSVRVACLLLGLPIEDADLLSGHVNRSFQRVPGQRGQTESGQAAGELMRDYLAKTVHERRRGLHRGEGLVDRMLDFDTSEGRLSDAEIVSNLSLLVVGGTETLPKVFAGAAWQLARHPAQRARVAAEPALAADAFWEALRLEMPTTMLGRTLREDVPLHGATLRAGQKVMFLWACANRDEREFADAEHFDALRRAPRLLSFGQGTHRCIGHNVARMEGRILLEELLARVPEYEVVEERAVRLRSEFFRGFASLPIRF